MHELYELYKTYLVLDQRVKKNLFTSMEKGGRFYQRILSLRIAVRSAGASKDCVFSVQAKRRGKKRFRQETRQAKLIRPKLLLPSAAL